jgi:cupin fold WbuC family metalloprotein
MIKTKEQNSEVLYATDHIIKVDGQDIALLKQRAFSNPRKRIRLCTHRSVQDNLHEMLIVHCRNSYVCPHKHHGKTISYHIIEGLADLVIFNETGDVLEVIRMGDYRSGLKFYYRIFEPYYYVPVVNSDFLIFQETTLGPFQSSDTIYAPWAPPENNNQEAGKKFLDQLRKKIVNKLTA